MVNCAEPNDALAQLSAEIRSCEHCALAAERTQAVPGDGDANAVVMFVGEGPGYDEDRQWLPFVGRSGQYLTQVMHEAGIRREDVYITNVVKCRPPGNRDPLPQELEACSDYLDRQVALINPRIIVTLGRFSMRRWFPGGAITRIHGQIRNIGRGRVALAMFHPAAALRNPQWQEAFAVDMRKLPPLIERALEANRRADAGEALPAGAAHPGDAEYEAPATDGKPRAAPSGEYVAGGDVAGRDDDGAEDEDRAAQSSGETDSAGLNSRNGRGDDAEQLSLW